MLNGDAKSTLESFLDMSNVQTSTLHRGTDNYLNYAAKKDSNKVQLPVNVVYKQSVFAPDPDPRYNMLRANITAQEVLWRLINWDGRNAIFRTVADLQQDLTYRAYVVQAALKAQWNYQYDGANGPNPPRKVNRYFWGQYGMALS